MGSIAFEDAADIDFTQLVRAGDTVMWSQGAGEPVDLIARLMEQRHAIGPFNVFMGASYSNSVRLEHTDVVRPLGMGAVGSNLALCRSSAMEVIPCHLSELPRLLEDGVIRVDVVIIQCSIVDGDRGASFGAVNGYVQYALDRARVRILQMNPNAPRTSSRNAIDLSRFDVVTRTSAPLVEIPESRFSDIEARIASNIAEYIRDGDVLQAGIGAVPRALLRSLGTHRNLGFHSGVLGDAAMALIKAGVIDNSKKSIDRGVSVTGALAGSQDLYRFADGNAAIAVEPVTYTHAIGTLSSIGNLVAVNSAIEVDLTGQISSEVVADSYLGTIGGQVDFVRGAMASQGGRSIIGLPSRTRKGDSRIVARFDAGIVTVPRSDADIFATEYGAVELRGQTIPQRVRRMISIAHPEDREVLERTANDGVVGFRSIKNKF
jgi:acetyl-CoA hydrolase